MNLLEKINFEGKLLKIKRESSDIPGVKEIVEGYLSSYMDHNPITVAKSFMESTKNVAYEPNVKEIRESIVKEYSDFRFIYELNSVQYDIKRMNSPFYSAISATIDKILESEDDNEVKTAIKQDLSKHSYISQIKNLVEFANQYDRELNSTADHYAETVYSPVHVTERGNTIFNSLGVNFAISEDNNLVEAPIVQNRLYNDLVEAVNTFKFTDNEIKYYNKDNKLSLTENEGELKLEVNGKEIAIDENLRTSLLTQRVFDANSFRQLDLLEKVIENYSNIVRLDNVKQLHMRNFENKKLNVLTLENSFAIHKMDTHTRLNKIDIFETANEAIADVKEFIGYDLSESLKDHLQVEKSELENLKEKRANLIDKIEFLKEEKEKLSSDESIAESEAIIKANELIANELKAHTNELEKVTSKISKLTEKKSDYTDQGFVEGIVKKNPPSNLKRDISKGDDIWIFAEDYTTSGSKDDIIVKLENGKELKVKKELVAPTS